MNGSHLHSMFTAVGRGLVVFAVLLASPVVQGDEDPHKQTPILTPYRDIYGSQEAADLVAEARAVDPLFCPRKQADRDRAVALYEKAIAAQPGAKLNAPLADRIAQLYAFYEDKEKGISPRRGAATRWWNRCAELTSRRQLLWAQAQMGLASMAVASGDHVTGSGRYSTILELDIDQFDLPDWKAWPDGSTERGKAILERERARLRESVERVQTRAAEKQFYALSHLSKDSALLALQQVAARFRGTPTGERAAAMVADICARLRGDPWALPENLLDVHVAEVGPRASPAQEREQPTAAVAPPVPPAPAEQSSGPRGTPVIAAATVVGTALVVGALLLRRRNRLS